MNKPIVVTGAAGFIGRNVVAGLNALGHDNLILVDRLHSGEKWKNLVGLQYEDFIDKDEFIESLLLGDITDIDAIIHMGACSATTEKDADYLLENNYRYTRLLCEWCLEHDARFITASSAATYGDGDAGYSDDDAVTPTLRPLNMYGYSKHMFDLWALKHNYYTSIVGLKFFNVYGPFEDHKDDMRSVVHKAFHQICDTGKVKLFKSYHPDYNDGEQVRDFVYVKDAVNVILHFLDNRDVGGLFNCGTGESRSWKALAEATFSAMDLAPNIEFIDMPDHLQGKYQYYTQADPKKLRAAGYKTAFYSLEEGIKDYVQNYLVKER